MKFLFIFLDASGMVKFWHYTSGKCPSTINEPDHTQILTLAVNPENTLFCTTGDDPSVHLYDINTQKKVSTLEPRYYYNRYFYSYFGGEHIIFLGS